jgi:2-polyprenyl-3-methyl-5-hydroxy-6-metoxy-1,4-benzoquinol methylase
MSDSKGYFDRHQGDWDAIYNAPSDSLRARLNRRLRRAVWGRMALALAESSEIGGRRALDVGCGPGELAIRLAERGAARVVGIDSAVEMIGVAKTRAARRGVTEQCHFVHADFLSGALGDETFDFTIALGVFDYVNDPAAFLGRMWRHTRGRMITSFPRDVPPRSWLRRLWHGAHGSRLHYYGASRALALAAGLEQASVRAHSITGSDSTDVLVCDRTELGGSARPPSVRRWGASELHALLESVW